MLASAARTSSARRSGTSSTARRSSRGSGWSAAHSGARSKNVRCCKPEEKPDAARGRLRAGARRRLRLPRRRAAGSSRKSSGPALLCARPNVTGRCVRRLISAIQWISERVPSLFVPGTLEARRDFVHALAVAAEHVGDREQLAFVGPRAGNESAVGDAVQQRARRREAERARAPIASSTRSVIAAMSSSVAGASSSPRSPIA